MLFYLRRIRTEGPMITEDLCFSTNFPNRQAFLEALQQWNINYANPANTYYGHGTMKFIEVPNSCVKKLFGSCKWMGNQQWPGSPDYNVLQELLRLV
jgi:hypothetical protein